MKIGLMFVALLMVTTICGCAATPQIVMESGFQRKVITPCDNDILCFRNTYDVTWDNSYRENSTVYGSPQTSRRYVPQQGVSSELPQPEAVVGTYNYLNNSKVVLFVRRINTTTGHITKMVTRDLDYSCVGRRVIYGVK